jgi:hypothetical protein
LFKDLFPYDISTIPLKETCNAQIIQYARKSTLRYGSGEFDDQHHSSVPFSLGGILGSDVTTTSGGFASIAVFSHVSIQKTSLIFFKTRYIR